MAKQYIIRDDMGQIGLGPDWPELMFRGRVAMDAALYSQQQEEDKAAAEWDTVRATIRRTCDQHAPICDACPYHDQARGCQVFAAL